MQTPRFCPHRSRQEQDPRRGRSLQLVVLDRLPGLVGLVVHSSKYSHAAAAAGEAASNVPAAAAALSACSRLFP